MTVTAAKARRVIHPTDVDVVHQVADAHEPAFAAVIAAGLKTVRDAVSLDDLTDRISVLTDIDDLIEWDELFTLPEAMTKVSGDDAAAEILQLMVEAQAATGIVEAAFSLTNPHAIAWAEQHAAELVLGLRNDSREAIRSVIVRSVSGGATAQQAARLVKASLGLSPAHANALVAFEQALRTQLAGGRPVRDGALTPRIPQRLREVDVQRLVDTYSRRLLSHRAETIARTEVQRAAHRGMLLNWQEAADAGMFDRSTALRRWVVTPDDRLCDVCRPMQGQTIGFTEDFESTQRGVGRRARPLAQATTTLTPPLHPRCRCTMVLITDGPLAEPDPNLIAPPMESLTLADVKGTALSADERDALRWSLDKNTEVVPTHIGSGQMTFEFQRAGRKVGHAQRSFDGRSVYHALLSLDDDVQGEGIATAFNAAMDRWYLANGIEQVQVTASLSTGGYTWARAGFDWDTGARDPLGTVPERMEHWLKRNANDPAHDEVAAMLARLDTEDPLSPSYPTPAEIAGLGYDHRVEHKFSTQLTTWAGKKILLGSSWHGVRYL